jgi:starch synthase
LKILLASSEVFPYSKTGGLADMVGALGKALARGGHRVGIITPLYLGIRERFPALKPQPIPLDLALGLARVAGTVWTLDPEPGLTLYFIDQPGYYQRPGLYQQYGADYPDNAERFIFFSKAVAHLALHLDWKPELLHLHDWQAAFASLLMTHQRKVPGWENAPRTCLTIHNLAYQGLFPANRYLLTNLPWDYFNPEGVEFYAQMNCLKTGIAFADFLTTVSPRYAEEITTPEFGCGLDGLLRNRSKQLLGILNGVDYEEWNPERDEFLVRHFSADHLEQKIENKIGLQKELNLPVNPAIPLFGNIGRLVQQKGVDILLDAVEEMVAADFQFALLGTGAPQFERGFRDLAARFPDRVVARIGYEEGLSHRIEAGADFFVMPSRFEPCGLNQMYSLRYGTVPIVRKTGGLDNSVIDPREDAGQANGIKFTDYSAGALAKALQKGLALYKEPAAMTHFRHNGMRADFSWERTAQQYVDLFNTILPAVGV